MPPRVQTVDSLPTNFLRCRVLRHAWEEFLDTEFMPSYGRLTSYTCPSCTTRRYDIIDSRGDLAYRSYVYPEGYKLDMPSDRAEMILEYFSREDRKIRARAARLKSSQSRVPSLRLVATG